MRISIRFLLVVMVVLVAALAASAGRPPGCVDVTLSVEPQVACSGDGVDVAATVTNCGTRRDRVRLTVVSSVPVVGASDRALKLRPGQTMVASLSAMVPPGAPMGRYAVMVTADSRRGGSDSTDTTFDIVPCP